MTREAFEQIPNYTIDGTGPYVVTQPYLASSEIVVMVEGDSGLVSLSADEYQVDPEASETEGSVYLTDAAAATYAGLRLYLYRDTQVEQGWAGATAREKGLEEQLDRLTQALQEQKDRSARGLAVASGVVQPYSPEDGCVPAWDEDLGGFVNGPHVDDLPEAEANAERAEAAAQVAQAAAALLDGALEFAVWQEYSAAELNAGPVTLPATPISKASVWVVAGVAGPQSPDEFELDGDQLTLTGGLPTGVDSAIIWVMGRVTEYTGPTVVTGEEVSFLTLADAKAAIAIGLTVNVGVRLNVGSVQFVYDGVSSALAGMPGYKVVGQLTFQHFGDNTTPGSTDMSSAVQAALAYLNAGQTTEYQIVNNTQARRISGLGEVIALGSTAFAGMFDANQDGTAELGCGPLYGVAFFDVTFKAIGSGWTADLAGDADVGRPMLFVGDYRNSTFTSNSEFDVARIRIEETCEFDCNFLSDGVYFENTARCRASGPVYNIRKNGYGYGTSYQNSALNSRGFSTKNMEIEFVNHRADGNHRFDGNGDFPVVPRGVV